MTVHNIRVNELIIALECFGVRCTRTTRTAKTKRWYIFCEKQHNENRIIKYPLQFISENPPVSEYLILTIMKTFGLPPVFMDILNTGECPGQTDTP